MNASRQLSLIAAIVLSLSAGCGGGGGGDNPPPPPPGPSCTDGVKNGTETGTDCGGGCATKCADGMQCLLTGDCVSGFCTPANVCATPTCSDTWLNGDEPGPDCGGPCLPDKKCVDGLGCDTDADCVNGYCNASKICGTPTCTDGAQNGLETGEDCGGATCVADNKKCADGLQCLAPADCVSGFCNGGTCATPTCTDGTKNGFETGVDCGGTVCVGLGKTCPTNATCIIAADCTSGVCDAGGVCRLPPCANGVKDGTETDVDCGGPQCTFEGRTCADSRSCSTGTDCASSYCSPTNVCATPTCADGWVNGNETGQDCGGGTCPDCANGLGCAVDGDCTSNFCNPSTHLCAAPTCSDGWRNGAETDVDCGGSCPTKCPEGFGCAATGDCATALVCDATTHVCAVQCLPKPATCVDNGDCCSGYCDKTVPGSFVCADPPATCKGNGTTCAFNSDCCTSYCDPSKVCGTAPTCRGLDVACSANADCCDQYCNPSTRLCDVPVSTCEATGSTCASGAECCSKACNTTTNACTSTAFCKVAGASCVNSGECCSVSCVAGVCSDTTCEPTGSACTSGAECCTGTCTANLCATIPAPSGTTACATLGDACNPAADTCCSKNCQGGICTPAFTCHAPSDLCYRNEDCCSGKCTSTSPTVAGRCLAPTGGDIQGGAPCDGPTTCVTRICADLGSGQTVCKPAGGCRMTGDYCNPNEYSTTTACTTGNYKTVCWPLYGDNATCKAGFCTNPNGVCCGGTPDKVDPGGYGVECAPKQVGAPTLCSNGQSCNPPGNICGAAGDNASQNCCAGQKAVCKRDMNGIARCFGGGSTTCPTGYDGSNPACCIGTDPGASGFDNVCQFRDQCCNFVPCVPDADGILRCTPAVCIAQGAECAGADDGSCCDGLACTWGAGTFTCEVPTSCGSNGASCTHANECCSGNCTAGICSTCEPLGSSCTSANECCSNNCTGGLCAMPCAAGGTTCTVDADCCTGLACSIPPGSTSGTCESVSTCAPSGSSCVADADCCNNGLAPPLQEICDEGRCAVPATCVQQFASCTPSSANCCDLSLGCIEQDGTACAPGSTTCSCDQCAPSGGGCDPSAVDTGCCTGLQCYGTGAVGTCSSCVIGGGSCSSTADCCPGTPGGPSYVCADDWTGEACAGGICSCSVCGLSGAPCSANGVSCCGDSFCAAPDGIFSCGPDDLDCACKFMGE